MKNILYQLLQLCGVHHTRYFLHHFIQSHGDEEDNEFVAPLLEAYNIDSMVVRFGVNELYDADFPVVAQTNENDRKQHIILTGIDDDKVNIVRSDGKKGTLPLAGFEKIWTGVAILIDAAHARDEPDYHRNKSRERQRNGMRGLAVGLLVALVILYSYFQAQAGSWVGLPLLLLQVAGVYICSQLMKASQKVGLSGFSSRICKLGKATSCEKVLNSSAAFFKGTSLAEVGLVFFLVQFSWLLFAATDSSYFSFVMWSYGATLPFTCLSIAYQWKKVKAWCPLCLLVVVICWFSWLLFLMDPFSPYAIPTTPILAVGALSACLMVCGFYAWKTLWVKNIQNRQALAQYRDLQNDLDVISPTLAHGRRITGVPLADTFEIGTPGATNELVVVVSPFCPACARLFHQLMDFLTYFEGYLSVKLVPIASSDPLSQKVAHHMMNLLSQKQEALNHIDNWYGLKKHDAQHVDRWKESSPVATGIPSGALKETVSWLRANQLNHVPCLILNCRLVNTHFGLVQIKKYLKFRLNEPEAVAV